MAALVTALGWEAEKAHRRHLSETCSRKHPQGSVCSLTMKEPFPIFYSAIAIAIATVSFAHAGEIPQFRLYGQTVEAQFASAEEAGHATLSFRELPPDMEMSLSARSDDTNWRHLDHARALAAAGAKSTYYIGGVSSDYAEKVLRPILALGHSLGSHTKNHPHLPAFNANGIFYEILGNRIDIEAATDSCVSSFTLPFCDRENKANPDARAAIGESLLRSGILGGGDVLEDPTATYGLPTNAIVGCLHYSFDDRNPSRDLFVKGVSKAEERIKANDLPPCGPHVVMGMHSWANDEGMAELTPCFETRTKNPDAPFADHTWVCNENEFIAAWMMAHHSRVAKVERNGGRVRWSILRPEPAELGADVPLFAEFNCKPIAITLDGATASVNESAQTALPNSPAHRIPTLIEHLPAPGAPGKLAPSAKFPGLRSRLDINSDAGTAVVRLENAGGEPLRNLRATLRLPLAFARAAIPKGSPLPETVNVGDAAEAHFRLGRLHDDPWFVDGPALFDAELYFDIGDKAGRLHVTQRILTPRTEDRTSLRDCVRASSPLHIDEWPAEKLAELSRPGSPLEGLRLFPLDAPPLYAPCTFNFSSRLPEAEALAAAFPKETLKDLLNLIVGEFTASGRDATLVARGGGTLFINGDKVEFKNGTRIKTLAGLNRIVLSLPMNDWRRYGILAVFEDGADSSCLWSPPVP